MRSIAVFALVSACSGPDATRAQQPSPANARAPQPVVVGGRLVPGSVPQLGCFAWSPTLRTAACIVGYRSDETAIYLQFVGRRREDGIAPMKLTDPLDAATVTAANDALARGDYQAFTSTATPLPAGGTQDVGSGVTLRFVTRWWTGPDPKAPTRSQILNVRAKCPHDDTNVIGADRETGESRVTVRDMGGDAIIEMRSQDIDAGQPLEDLTAVIFHAADCATYSNAGPNLDE